jgi:uncharacterized protein (DUF433 family)
MARAAEKVTHSYIVSRKDYCGGNPVIKGTKFPVHSVVNYILRQGFSPEELVKEFSHLTLAQVYDALSYYYDHTGDIERELEKNAEERLRAKKAG